MEIQIYIKIRTLRPKKKHQNLEIGFRDLDTKTIRTVILHTPVFNLKRQ